MLLCGFEKFDNLFVRIDILERLFVQIINATSKENSEIKMIPEMLNLLGCSKENFKKLLQKMGYKTYEKEQDMFFKYNPVKKFKKTQNKKASNENPNEYFTPNYLLKLALVYEEIGDLDSALDTYEEIIEDFKNSPEYQTSVKNKSRIEGLLL